MPFDAHCHAVKDLSSLLNEELQYVAIMATTPEENQRLLNLPKNPNILIGLGMHPWLVDANKFIEEDYIKYLDSCKFDFVGEIGIDKVATDKEGKKYNWDKQAEVFEKIFILACKYQLPVSIHCARAYGYICEFFKSLECIDDTISKRQRKKLDIEHYGTSSSEDEYDLENHLKLCKSRLCHNNCKITPKIMMHSYSGSPETSSLLSNLTFGSNFYFSFSAVINRRSMKKFENAVKSVPVDRILLESDVDKSEEIIPFMNEIVEMMATVLNLDQMKIREIGLGNGKEFYGIK